MEDPFRQFLWLIVPLTWLAVAGWRAWLSARRSRDALNLVDTYAAAGREPPAELLRLTRGRED